MNKLITAALLVLLPATSFALERWKEGEPLLPGQKHEYTLHKYYAGAAGRPNSHAGPILAYPDLDTCVQARELAIARDEAIGFRSSRWLCEPTKPY